MKKQDKGIFRVPTVIVYRNGIEVNRINEFPALSLEHDLYAILNGQPTPLIIKVSLRSRAGLKTALC